MKSSCKLVVALILCVTLLFTSLSVVTLAETTNEGEITGEVTTGAETTDITTDEEHSPKDDFGVALSVDKNKVKPGDTITVSLEFTGNPGINSYIGTVKHDSNAVEYIDGSVKLDAKVDSDIKEVSYNGAVKLKIQDSDGFDKTGSMMTAQYRIKDGVTGSISFSLETAGVLDTEDNAVAVNSADISVEVLPAADSITLDKTELTLEKGQTEQLTATVTPDNIGSEIKWTSSDETVVSVDGNGKLTAVKPGSAVITAKADNKTAECTVTVISKLTGIDIEKEILLSVGKTHKLTVTFSPEDTTDAKTLTWTSSDESIATVDENGVVTAVSNGRTTVSVQCGQFVEICNVTVKYIEVSQIILSKTELELKINDSATLTAEVFPENATDYGTAIQWSSSDESVAVVDANGKITAVSGGTARIIAKVGNKKSECRVTVVEKKAMSLIVGQSKLEMEIGEKITLDVTVNPKDTTDLLVFTTSDTKVATVTQKGRITAVGAGTAEITVKVGSHTKTCVVTVAEIETNIKSVVISQAEANVTVGADFTLTYVTDPADAEPEKVVWTSSDDTVATVDENGKVTAVSAGTAQIFVSVDGITAVCTVTVEDAQTTEPETQPPVTQAPVTQAPDTTTPDTTSPYQGNTHQPTPGRQSTVFKIILVVIIILILSFIGITVVYFINRRNMYEDYDDDDDYEYDDEDEE